MRVCATSDWRTDLKSDRNALALHVALNAYRDAKG